MPPNALVERDLRSRVAPKADAGLLGDRFVASEDYARLRRSRGATVELSVRDLVSATEAYGEVRTRTVAGFDNSLALMPPSKVEGVQDLPYPATLPGLCDFTPTETAAVFLWSESALTPTGVQGTPYGVEAGHLATDWQKTVQNEAQWPVISSLPLEVVLDSPERLRKHLNLQQTRAFWRSVEADMISGDGSTSSTRQQLAGILNTAGLSTVARVTTGTADYNVDTISNACSTIQTAGFLTPLSVLASPKTLRSTFRQRDGYGQFIRVQETLPWVERFVPCLSLPDGVALVGAFEEAIEVFMKDGGLSVEMSQDVWDATNSLNYWRAGLVQVRTVGHVWSWVKNVGALAQVTGLVAV